MEKNTLCVNCMNEFDGSESLICPHCGFDQNSGKKEPYHLDPGYMLKNRYIIGNAIGSGGFGITYIAWDTVLDKKVAIKEYFPTEFATRLQGTTELCSYDGEKHYMFTAGLSSFVEEALRLAKLNYLPHIVHIFDSFEENCTAYIVMEYVDGENLKDMLKANGPLPYEDVVKYAIMVLEALQKVHEAGIVHRDIAPDNIKIDGDNVVLLDFGAARNATSGGSKSLSIIVKPGYAPHEQYMSHGEQGPWSDVYAMGAVMYHLITGKVPQESIERVAHDELKTPTEIGFAIPENIENAIMNALNVEAEYRIQTAEEFAEALKGTITLEAPVKKVETKGFSKKSKITIATLAAISAALILIIIVSSTNITNTNNKNEQYMPNLMAQSKEEAFNELEADGIQYYIDGTEELEGVSEDTELIAYQSIEPQTPIGSDTVVNLKIAKAPLKDAVVPDLSALTKSEAAKALEKVGFTNYEFKEKTNDKYKSGLVCDQSQAAKNKIPLDTKITVYIAKNTPTTTRATTRQTTRSATTKKQTTTKKSTTQKQTTTKKSSGKSAVNWDDGDAVVDN